MEFVRTRRLDMVLRDLLDHGITVGEAAHRAGYSNTANFSTAFQRQFGYPPSVCLGQFPLGIARFRHVGDLLTEQEHPIGR